MTLIYIAVVLLLLSGWILLKYYRLDYGVQTWHLFAIRLFSFSGFVLLFIGFFSMIYSAEPEDFIGEDKPSKMIGPVGKEVLAIADSASIKCYYDTCILTAYLCPLVATQLDSLSLLIPVVTVGKDDFYLFRVGSVEKLLPVDDTEFVKSGINLQLITEKRTISKIWFGEVAEQIEEVRYIIGLNQPFRTLQ